MQTQAIARIDRERGRIATELSWRSCRRPTAGNVARLQDLARRDRALATQRRVIVAGLRLTRNGWLYYATFHTDANGPTTWAEYAAHVARRTGIAADVLEAEMQAAGFALDAQLPVRPSFTRTAAQA